jgi:hypothetical protein
VVGRMSDGQMRALNRSRLDSVPNTVTEARGVPLFAEERQALNNHGKKIRPNSRSASIIQAGLWR